MKAARDYLLTCCAVLGLAVLPSASAANALVSPAERPVYFQYAVYFLPTPTSDPRKALLESIKELDPSRRVLNQVPAIPPTDSTVILEIETDVAKDYAPPDLQSLQYFGRGITLQQAEAVQLTKEAFLLTFVNPRSDAIPKLDIANRIAERVARRTGGLLWDDETRELFTPDEWHNRRIAEWSEPPDISRQFTIHAYSTGTYVRAVTLGMAKVGLPDILIDQFSWSDERAVGNLINTFAQAMVEGAKPAVPGDFDLDLKAIKNTGARDKQLTALKSGANAVAHLRLAKGKPDDGDPRNALIEIEFDRYPGANLQEKQDRMLSEMFGAEDSTTEVRHQDPTLAAASERARQRLPALEKMFHSGLTPGEYIMLKLPFATPTGGTEYMWVEVTHWSNGLVSGLLRNDPEHIPGLHGGQEAGGKESDVFDYILRHNDGSSEGNETGKLIQEMTQ